MGGRSERERRVVAWLVIGTAAAGANGALQVVLTRTLSYLYPIHMLTALSLVLGASIFFLGVGAFAGQRARRRPGAFSIAAGVAVLAGVLGQFPLAQIVPAGRPVATAALAAFVAALPMAALGALTAAAYIQILRDRPAAIGRLVALGALAFFAFYFGATFGVRALGLVGVTASVALAAAVGVGRRPRDFAVVGVLEIGRASCRERVCHRV